MPRNIVFTGNCQANSVHRLFAAAVAPITGDDVQFVPCFLDLSDHSKKYLEEADIVVSQILDSPQVVSLNTLRQSHQINPMAQVIEFPLISGAFLWPHAGSIHVLNQSMQYFAPGPFGQDFGNTFLNREILRGSDPSIATDAYLDLDIAQQIDLDRLYELHRIALQKKDARSGFTCADFIDTWYRKECLFQSQTVLSRRLNLYLASVVFSRLGIEKNIIEVVHLNTWTILGPHTEVPIHPSIIKHFDLEYVTSESRYLYYTGENLTFRRYVEKYLQYDYNDPLFRALYANDWDKSSSAGRKRWIAQIRTGLSASEGSASAYFELSNLLFLEGHAAAALDAMQTACELDPRNVRYRTFLSIRLKDGGKFGRAEEILRIGLIEWPGVAILWYTLSDVLRLQGKFEQAAQAAARAAEIEPYNADFQKGLALSLLQTEQLPKALNAARQAGALSAPDPYDRAQARQIALQSTEAAPQSADFQKALALSLLQADLLPEALAAARKAADLEPTDAHNHGLLGKIAMQTGDFEAGKAAFLSAAALLPEDPWFFRELAHWLGRRGQFGEAAQYMKQAVDLKPDIAENNAILAYLLKSSGQDIE